MSWYDENEPMLSREENIFNDFLSQLYLVNDNKRRNQELNLKNHLGTYYSHVVTYIISGGDCWNEDEHDEDMIPSHDILKNIDSQVDQILQKIQSLELDTSKIEDWKNTYIQNMGSYCPVGTYFVNEYYGNGSQYAVYKIDFNDFIDQVCTDQQKDIYQKCLNNFEAPLKNKFRPY